MSTTEIENQNPKKAGPVDDERSRIKAEKNKVQADADAAKRFNRLLIQAWVLAILTPQILLFWWRDIVPITIWGSLTLILSVTTLQRVSQRQFNRPYEEEIAELNQQLELLEDTSEERRAERLFKLHQLDLKKYYSQTLRQAQSIFTAGLCCLVLGVLIIIGVIALIYGAQNADLGHQILLASTGVVSGILTNFVGAIFLKMYTETIRSLSAFHNRLVTTHHMHYGALLAAKITDRRLLNETLSKMAIGTIGRSVEKEGADAESGKKPKKKKPKDEDDTEFNEDSKSEEDPALEEDEKENGGE